MQTAVCCKRLNSLTFDLIKINLEFDIHKRSHVHYTWTHNILQHWYTQNKEKLYIVHVHAQYCQDYLYGYG